MLCTADEFQGYFILTQYQLHHMSAHVSAHARPGTCNSSRGNCRGVAVFKPAVESPAQRSSFATLPW
mgnify:CR=1 FL=1